MISFIFLHAVHFIYKDTNVNPQIHTNLIRVYRSFLHDSIIMINKPDKGTHEPDRDEQRGHTNRISASFEYENICIPVPQRWLRMTSCQPGALMPFLMPCSDERVHEASTQDTQKRIAAGFEGESGCIL
jgi:hypothetical protein